MPDPNSFFSVITEAVNDIAIHGYDSEWRLKYWVDRIRAAAWRDMIPEAEMQKRVRDALTSAWDGAVTRGGLLRQHPSLDLFTFEKLKPKLRDELTRRVAASADLIKLNRAQAVETTLRRFTGWTTSVPIGGTDVAKRVDIKTDIRKGLAELDYIQRRVATDQGAKFLANLSDIIATDGGAIAGRWHSRWRSPGYQYRPKHKERDGKIYTVRNNWAQQAGLMKAGPAGYTDEITQPAEEVYCLPGDVSIPFADGVEVAYRRWYSGELTEIIVESGKTLRATPNHPVLTPEGWVAIGSLNDGDYVIEAAKKVINPSEQNENVPVPLISDIFTTLESVGVSKKCRGKLEQFHGDGSDGDIDVVYAARPLSFGMKTKPGNSFYDPALTVTANHTAFLRLFQFLGFRYAMRKMCGTSSLGQTLTPLWRSFDHSFMHHIRTNLADFGVGCSRYLLSLFKSSIGISKGIGFRGATYSLAGISQSVYDRQISGKAEFAGNFGRAHATAIHSYNRVSADDSSLHFAVGEKRFSGEVPSLDISSVKRPIFESKISGYLGEGLAFHPKPVRVIKVRHGNKYIGHVYNLQTRVGWYVADGVIHHNCSCRYTYLYALRELPDEMLTQRGRDELARVRAAAA